MLASSSAWRVPVRVLCRVLLFGEVAIYRVEESLTGMSSSPLGKFSVAAVTSDWMGESSIFGSGLAVIVFSCTISKLPFCCRSRPLSLFVKLGCQGIGWRSLPGLTSVRPK